MLRAASSECAMWWMHPDSVCIILNDVLIGDFREGGGESMRKAYTTPRLTVHGSVEKITLAGNPPFGAPGPPGSNPSNGGVAPGLGSQVGNTGNNPQSRP